MHPPTTLSDSSGEILSSPCLRGVDDGRSRQQVACHTCQWQQLEAILSPSVARVLLTRAQASGAAYGSDAARPLRRPQRRRHVV
jgi:hypothetical protein